MTYGQRQRNLASFDAKRHKSPMKSETEIDAGTVINIAVILVTVFGLIYVYGT